jgi:hypothetical protein
MSDADPADARAIEAIITQLFNAISWDPVTPPDLAAFAAPVLPDAALVPSARPPAVTSIKTFSAMMAGQHAAGAMQTFQERPLATRIFVFGNIAVALGGFEMRIDGGAPGLGANAFLLIRDAADWKIAAMAWDSARPGQPLPESLGGTCQSN